MAEHSVLGLRPGSVVQDSYRIERLLGEGGMAATFAATNLATGHPVALKVMSPAFSANRKAVELFRRESTLLRSVRNDAVIGYETTLMDAEGRLFLIMEFVDGKPLSDYVRKGLRLKPQDVLALGARLAGGLAAIHALGIVHRDIAPDNILIPHDDITEAKLIDFGLASDTVGTDQSIIGDSFAGKLSYCAPEQLGLYGNKARPATDAYALGLKPLSIRLLITKSELSDLQQALQIIVDKAEENVIDPDKFFAQVLAAAADMSRRPDQISRRGGESLAESAAIAEYIEDLPYKSRIMSVTEGDWVRLSISEQQTIVNELHEKIERYRRYNEATDAWVDYLGQGAGAEARVYPIRLDDLP